VAVRAVEQEVDDGRVDERHVAGDHDAVLAARLAEARSDSGHRALVRLRVQGDPDRVGVLVEDVEVSVALVGPAVHHEFVGDGVETVGDAAEHRGAGEVRKRLVPVAVPGRAAAREYDC